MCCFGSFFSIAILQRYWKQYMEGEKDVGGFPKFNKIFQQALIICHSVFEKG